MDISNKALRLQFNSSGHLVSWSDLTTGTTHQLNHQFIQEAERENLDEWNVCDGTNVYTFVPDNGATVLTPKVRHLLLFGEVLAFCLDLIGYTCDVIILTCCLPLFAVYSHHSHC